MPSALPVWNTIGFTGHRDLKDATVVADAIRLVFYELAAEHAPLAAVCSAASGADTLFLDEVAGRGLPYFLVFPFAKERFRQDFNHNDWEHVATHFCGALDSEVVDGVDNDREAYLECGVRTVDRCDVLIAVWNGEPAAGKGGTGDIVDYARSLRKPLIWINSVSGERQSEQMERLVQRPAVAEAAAGSTDVGLPATQRQQVVGQYRTFNATAKTQAPRARQLIQQIIRLHLFATAIAITGCVLALGGQIEHLLGACEIGVLCGAFYLARRHRRAHHDWTHTRTAAELCRSFLACWAMRRRGAKFPSPRLEHQDELLKSLRMAWYLDPKAERPLETARDEYITGRVNDQILYFQDKYQTAGNRGERLKVAAMSVTFMAILFGAITLGIAVKGYDERILRIFKLCAMLFPLIPPALLSLILAHDLSRRAQRFGEVTTELQEARERLRAVRTWPGLWREVNRCENLLLQEVAEWLALTRFAAESH